MLYTGIDLHRRSIVVCTVDESGTIIDRRSMKTHQDVIATYFRQWNSDHRAVVEITTGWYWLCDLLRSLGVTIILAHAKYLKAISYAKVKTDAVDAQTLAQLLRMGYIPEAHHHRSIVSCAISYANAWSWNTSVLISSSVLPASWHSSIVGSRFHHL